MDRFFGDEPTHDPMVRIGRSIGNVIGLLLYLTLIWVVLHSF